MIKTYNLKEDQPIKIERDNVEVIMTKTETFTKAFNKTASSLKAEIARLDQKLLDIKVYKAEIEAELVEVEKEVDKYVYAKEILK